MGELDLFLLFHCRLLEFIQSNCMAADMTLCLLYYKDLDFCRSDLNDNFEKQGLVFTDNDAALPCT